MTIRHRGEREVDNDVYFPPFSFYLMSLRLRFAWTARLAFKFVTLAFFPSAIQRINMQSP
jgi:hypothetical protein